jgi:hypothetical protein
MSPLLCFALFVPFIMGNKYSKGQINQRLKRGIIRTLVTDYGISPAVNLIVQQ